MFFAISLLAKSQRRSLGSLSMVFDAHPDQPATTAKPTSEIASTPLSVDVGRITSPEVSLGIVVSSPGVQVG